MLFGTKSHYTLINCVMIFKVDAQMLEILMDFSMENPGKNPPFDFNRSGITAIVAIAQDW